MDRVLRGRPTIRDVAALAEVGTKTVSRVVNGEPGVSDALAQRVRRAVEELDFRPNHAASSLRRSDGKTAAVALLLEDLANPFSAAVHRAFSDVARERGVMVFAASLDEDPVRERELVRAFLARRADALVVAPAGADQSHLADTGVPVVCVDRAPRGLAADGVLSTNEDGAADAVAHLLRAGHSRVAFLGDLRGIATARSRYAGYTRAMAAAGREVRAGDVVHDLHTADRAADAVLALLQQPDPPTALFAAQNLVTVGAVRALHRLGLQHRVALVGFDDFPIADLLDPGITVVAQDPAQIGRTAAEVVFTRLDGAEHDPRLHLVPTRLLTRGSGELPAA